MTNNEKKKTKGSRPTNNSIDEDRTTGGATRSSAMSRDAMTSVSSLTEPTELNNSVPPLAAPTVSRGDDLPGSASTVTSANRRQQSRGDDPLPSPRSSTRNNKRSLHPTASTIAAANLVSEKSQMSFPGSVASNPGVDPNRPKVASRKMGREALINRGSDSPPPSPGNFRKSASHNVSSPGAVAVFLSDAPNSDEDASHFLSIESEPSPSNNPTHSQNTSEIRTEALIEASLVSERSVPIQQDVEVASNENTGAESLGPLVKAEKMTRATTRVNSRVVFIIALILVVTLGIMLGVWLSRRDDSTESKASKSDVIGTLTPSSAPNHSPTSSPTSFDIADFIQNSLPEYSREALEDDESPQFRALEWLNDDPNLGEYSEARKLQRFALSTFFFSTGGEDFWHEDEGWLSYDESECNWNSELESMSLVCNRAGDFRALNLAGIELHGELPHEINLLTSLVSLRLDDNDIYGHLPSFEGLSNLETISLDGSDLSGPIPSSLAEVVKLRSLYFANNQLTGELPPEALSAWSVARDIDFGNNELKGNIPVEIGELKKVEYLYLQENQFSGNIPAEICDLRNLRVLWLSRNDMKGTIPSCLGELAGLQELELEDIGLAGEIPEALCSLSDLRVLLLSSNDLDGTIPDCFGDLESLVELHLGRNNVTGSVPEELCDRLEDEDQLLESIVVDCDLIECGCNCDCWTSDQPTLSPTTTTDSPALATTEQPSLSKTTSTRSPTRSPTRPPTRRPTAAPITQPPPSSLPPPPTRQPTNVQTRRPTLTPTRNPTARPTARPTTPLDVFLTSLPSSTRTAIQNEGSPQAMAFSWLQADPSYGIYSNTRRLQRFVLATFYHSTNGNSWHKNSGWLSYSSECSWYADTNWLDGPPCEGDSLVGLALIENRLEGNLPEELGLLSSLMKVNLSFNDLWGALPAELGDLVQIESFDVEENLLTS